MKYCKDFAYAGIDCCMGCHYEADTGHSPLSVVTVDGESAQICCELIMFFYPDGGCKVLNKDDR